MAGNTYKWVGGNGALGDINDAIYAANWDILNNGTFQVAAATPGIGDLVLIPGGAINSQITGTAEIPALSIEFDGSGATFTLNSATLDDGGTISALASSAGTLDIAATVLSHASIEAAASGASIDILLGADLTSQNVLLASGGGAISVGTASSAGTFTNDGGIVAFGGNVAVNAPVQGFGVMYVASGTLTLGSGVSGDQTVVFGNSTATVAIDDPSAYGAKVLGFEDGDTIDLPSFAWGSATLGLSGTVLTVSNAAQSFQLSFNGSSFVTGATKQFSTSEDATGGTQLTVNTSGTGNPIVDALWLSTSTGAAGGSFSTGTLWSTGTAPTASTTAQIDALGGAFTVTASGANAVNSLIMVAPQSSLNVTGSLSATKAIFQMVGNIAETGSGASVAAKTFNQLGGGGTLTMGATTSMTLSGGSALPGNNGNAGLEIEGYASLDAATVTVNDSSVRIGWQGSGTMEATDGSTVTDSFADLGGSGTTEGALTIDNSQWTDTGSDSTAPLPGYMIVGGGDGNGSGGFYYGGSGTLYLQNGATLTDASGAAIAQSAFSDGTADIGGNALWNDEGGMTIAIAANSFGTLDMSSGTLTVADTLNIGGGGSLDMANGSSATVGTLELSGTATLDNSSLQTGSIALTNAQLTVQDNAVLTDSGSAQFLGLGNFLPQVQTGGTLSVTGNLEAGTVADTSGLNIYGGSLSVGGTLSVAGSLEVSNTATATVAALVQQGGTLSVDPSSLLQVGIASAGLPVSLGVTAPLNAVGVGPASGLIVEPGATYAIGGGASETSTLEVLGTLATSGATLNGALTGSGDITIASGTTLTVNAANTPWSAAVNFAPGGGGDYAVLGPFSNDEGTIGGLGTIANTVDFPGITFNSLMPLQYDAASGVLTLGSADGFLVGADITLEPNLILAYNTQLDASGGTAVVLSATPCYAAGTHIATPTGETPVEVLRPGDTVLVQEGAALIARPVRWVGSFGVDLARHPNPECAAPIRIAAHAFAEGVPHRDLRVSPDHAVLVDGVLMQAQALVNGATIRREPADGRVVYYHVELDRHGILLAEGLPAESYLDTGNRGQFAAETGVRPLFADLSAPRTWQADACAPLVLAGPLLTAAHARLLARAESLGHARTADPGLTVLANGVRVAVEALNDTTFAAALPAGATEVRLRSRGFVPNAFNAAAGDGRRLGIAVCDISLAGCSLPPEAFATGWHAAEPEWRWTDGDATLALPASLAARTLTIRIARAAPDYWVQAA